MLPVYALQNPSDMMPLSFKVQVVNLCNVLLPNATDDSITCLSCFPRPHIDTPISIITPPTIKAGKKRGWLARLCINWYSREPASFLYILVIGTITIATVLLFKNRIGDHYVDIKKHLTETKEILGLQLVCLESFQASGVFCLRHDSSVCKNLLMFGFCPYWNSTPRMAPVRKCSTLTWWILLSCLLWLGRFRQALPCLILSNYIELLTLVWSTCLIVLVM